MDNKKIGDLISKLRKEKGLTQQALGDLVGVGSGAVSKWERGLTLPDIAIINELSQILGISSDELLSGEIKEQPTSEDTIPKETNNQQEECEINNRKINTYNLNKILLIIIPLILIIISILAIYNHNKTYAYNILTTSDEYYVRGNVIFQGNKILILVNEIRFKDEEFNSTIIKNYEYDIRSSNTYLFRYGYIHMTNLMDKEKTIKEFFSSFVINYKDKTKLKKNKIIKNNIVVNIKFLDQNNNEINKKIEFSLEPIKN